MFKVGDKIAHPMHGAGIIENIEEKKVNGTVRSYYVLRIPVGNMLVMIPVDSCEAIGVRPILKKNEAEGILSQIPGIQPEMTQNWNRCYRENMLRIKSGDLLEVARVIKGLVERDHEKGLSTGERKMLRSAKQILISEMVLSFESSYEDVENRLDRMLA
ncbi:MAG: CarD family transcriptional regulator [Oscillospiraceae bacterium]|nr:CarD family transcriptional regulator [Oscillospiraceae bacterium]